VVTDAWSEQTLKAPGNIGVGNMAFTRWREAVVMEPPPSHISVDQSTGAADSRDSREFLK